MNNLIIKEVAKRKGKTLQEIAKAMNITYNGLYQKLNTPKYSTLQEIATILGCDVIELINPNDTHQHFYDDKTDEWLGIRKK
ncbi:helix-turn-helix domain-containing protein [Riemerella anatipestifer]|uniref:helix-turn-helix domain-containing protein n=1 Tax=Riemerella anatipestifer TaxID=34085 RepID=UPI00129E9EA7|nr:helix-turn-helix transcriptional regulator [Riemerella anatipestifer]MCW0493309.1 helix-turn-helix domain-containing protein [Riemerella anatipestifer]MDR7750928.1 helix-turn-helix transcriptional regulator [Riemerella anatipestifer]MDR7753063.1 helix-turn-helix transcriptional regulator [Riemerella anatipestifer]MDR7755075.1 helix-turn-helix transcriptional regulator [Riemerella anatipestifer]MDR7759211.1 helix-turn-helix transcriptional regulator [Riemerella anatipestifer]